MRRFLLPFLLALGLAASVSAQTQTTTTLAWDFPATTPAYIAAATQNQATVDGVALPAPVCVANVLVPTTTTCSATVPAAQSVAGAHAVVVQLTAEGVQRTTTVTLDPSKGRQPGGIRISVTVVVQAP